MRRSRPMRRWRVSPGPELEPGPCWPRRAIEAPASNGALAFLVQHRPAPADNFGRRLPMSRSILRVAAAGLVLGLGIFACGEEKGTQPSHWKELDSPALLGS